MAMAGRKDWVQADLRCLLCGRVVGRLVGPLPARDIKAGRPPQFAAFRPADETVPAVKLVGEEGIPLAGNRRRETALAEAGAKQIEIGRIDLPIAVEVALRK